MDMMELTALAAFIVRELAVLMSAPEGGREGHRKADVVREVE